MTLSLELLAFIIKAIIIVISILVVFGGAFAIASKGKGKAKGKLNIKNLNQQFDDAAKTLNEEIVSKKELKKQTKSLKKQKKSDKEKRVFVLQFDGDIKASAVDALREEITALLTVIDPSKDEVVVKLTSPGGVVHGYGLAASQLARLKTRGIPLTVAIDMVAASGGYMMACVADKIIAAPFAIIGSIGAVMQIPNFNRFLKKHDIDFEQLTAGEFKRTLTLFGENTDKGREKTQEELEEAHRLFKEFITDHRPVVNITQVATGEHWFATQAKELLLVDELCTSDDYLFNAREQANLYQVSFKIKKSLASKLSSKASTLFSL